MHLLYLGVESGWSYQVSKNDEKFKARKKSVEVYFPLLHNGINTVGICTALNNINACATFQNMLGYILINLPIPEILILYLISLRQTIPPMLQRESLFVSS